ETPVALPGLAKAGPEMPCGRLRSANQEWPATAEAHRADRAQSGSALPTPARAASAAITENYRATAQAGTQSGLDAEGRHKRKCAFLDSPDSAGPEIPSPE